MKTRREQIEDVIREAITAFPRTNYDEVMSPRRYRYIVRARWAAMAAVKVAFPSLSLPHIGRIFGRDHSTVLYGLSATRRARKAQMRLANPRCIRPSIEDEARASC